MRPSVLFPLLASCLALPVHAIPAAESRNVNIFADVILLDSAAYTRPSSTSKIANFRLYRFIRQPEELLDRFLANTIIPQLVRLIPGLNVVGGSLSLLEARIRPFFAIPLGDQEVSVHVPACKGERKIDIGRTGKNIGLLESNVDLGNCAFGNGNTVVGEIRAVDLPFVGDMGVEDVTNTIFFSPAEGWGVISDIDDTIKVSAVNDIFQTVLKTFLQPFEAVPSMPELFASLSSTLVVSNTQPLFMYLSSSPIQLYEHLQPFVRSRFPAGPVVLRNYTFTNIHAFIRDVQLPTREYKMAELRKMRQWYPKKKFLLIGDSTQEDPEAYGAAFRELGPDWVGCIWIRKVEGSENDDARFQAAFAGVPRQRWRVFNSPVADRLGEIRVASGSC